MNGETLALWRQRVGARGAMAIGLLAIATLTTACKDQSAESTRAEPTAANPANASAVNTPPPTAPAPPADSAPVLVAKPAPQEGVSAPVAAEPRKIPLNVQGVSVSGATVRVKGMEIGTDATVVDVSISFANRITSTTMMALTDTFLEDERGARLQIKRPDDNRNLTVHAGETLNGQLVFMGTIPTSARKMRLVFNEGNPDDNIVAPGLTIDLPLPGG